MQKEKKMPRPQIETKLEMSKRIVVVIIITYILSMAAAYTLPVLFEWVGNISLKVFQTTATLTGSVLIGYYGKAGFENYDKNKKLLLQKLNEEDDEDDENDDPEGGNG